MKNEQRGPMNGCPEILTVEEAAEFLKVSAATVRRLVQENRIPFFRIGRIVRIFKTGLSEALMCSGNHPGAGS